MPVKQTKKYHPKKHTKPELIPVKFYRSIFLSKRARIIAVCFVVAALLSLPFFKTKRIQAEETIFYPSVCDGSWVNSSAIAGGPNIDGTIKSTAKATGAGQKLICNSFTGDLPNGVNIIKTELEFSWVTEEQVVPQASPINESYDPVGDVDVQSNSDQPVLPENKEATEPTTIDSQTDIKTEQENLESPAKEVVPNSEPEVIPPTSFLPKLINIAQAQEIGTTDNSIQITEQPPEQATTQVDVVGPDQANETQAIDSGAEGENNTPYLESTIPADQLDLANNPLPIVDTQGTALFDLSYGLGDGSWQELAKIEQEKLNTRYPVSITQDEIGNLKISLTSRLTIDEINNLSLAAVKLVITHEGLPTEFGEPDLTVDTLIKEVSDDRYWVVLIQREKSKSYEIWYTDISQKNLLLPSAKRPENKIGVKADFGITQTETAAVDNSVISDVASPIITDTVKEAVPNEEINKQTNDQVITPSIEPALNVVGDNLVVKLEQEKTNWNLVAKDNLVGELSSLGIVNGVIIWLSPDQNATILFDISSQVISSQTLERNGETIIDFNNESYSVTPLENEIDAKIIEKPILDSEGNLINQ